MNYRGPVLTAWEAVCSDSSRVLWKQCGESLRQDLNKHFLRHGLRRLRLKQLKKKKATRDHTLPSFDWAENYSSSHTHLWHINYGNGDKWLGRVGHSERLASFFFFLFLITMLDIQLSIYNLWSQIFNIGVDRSVRRKKCRIIFCVTVWRQLLFSVSTLPVASFLCRHRGAESKNIWFVKYPIYFRLYKSLYIIQW